MPEHTRRPRRLRESLRYFNWLYNPFQGLGTSGIYDLLSTRVATEQGLYLNLGYWEEARDLDEASRRLARLVADTARMGPADTVLDVGFGFADQDMLWARTHGPARIIGLNITASQVALARHRVAEQGLAERIDLAVASATRIPLPAASVDKVVAVECAFHFHTRERFFREAFRVLKPGGRIALADIVPMPAAAGSRTRLQQRISWGLTAAKFAIPSDNAYTRPSYHAALALSGFGDIRIESIRDRVYAPLHQFLRGHPDSVARLHPTVARLVRLLLRLSPESLYRGMDYLLVSAVKPLQAMGDGGGQRAADRRQ